MNTPLRYVVLCAALVFGYATVSTAAEQAGVSARPVDMRIEMKNGLLRV
jgi:hypothetical protein